MDEKVAAVNSLLGNMGKEDAPAGNAPGMGEEARGQNTGGGFMVDAAMFPSLADKKEGDVVYLACKVAKITGRMMKMMPYQDEGEQDKGGTMQPAKSEGEQPQQPKGKEEESLF